MQIRKIMEKRILRIGAVMLVGAITIGAGYVLYRDGSETTGTLETSLLTTQEDDQDKITYYELSAGGQVVGYLPVDGIGEALVEKAYTQVKNEIGYDPEVSLAVAMVEKEGVDPGIASEADVVATLKGLLYEEIGQVKVKAYVMKIGDFTVALESEEALLETLEQAQSLYVEDDSAITVSLLSDEHNPMVMKPSVEVLQKELPEERVFVTSNLLNEPVDEDGTPTEDDASKYLEAVVKEVDVSQDVVVVENFVDPSEIVDVEAATELITKEHEQIKTYTVVSGDVPSVIALSNSMSTQELYDLNPGLEDNERRMQIGDELTIMVPEPEMTVRTVEDVIYTEIIDRDKVYINDPDNYIGTYTAVEEGSDGVLEIRATVTKVNGKVVDEVISEQTVLLEPVTATLKRGIKALPVTTATGKFEMPLLSYTLTSTFGPRWGRNHDGIDLAAPVGTKIKASDGGRVIQAGWDGGYGYAIEIDHGNGMTTKYGHCSALYVSVGDEVSQYETIAAVGNTGNSTGPHLHFEIRVNGVARDPFIYLQ